MGGGSARGNDARCGTGRATRAGTVQVNLLLALDPLLEHEQEFW